MAARPPLGSTSPFSISGRSGPHFALTALRSEIAAWVEEYGESEPDVYRYFFFLMLHCLVKMLVRTFGKSLRIHKTLGDFSTSGQV